MDLTGKKIQDTYGGLLNVGAAGVTGSNLVKLTDGFGNILPIEISSTTVNFTGNVSGITGGGGGATGPTGAGGALGFSGSFIDTTTQNNAGPAAANALTYNTVVNSYGISIVNNSQILISGNVNAVYNIQAVIQFYKTDPGDDTVFVWLSKNGSDIAGSTKKYTISGAQSAEVVSISYQEVADPGDYFEIYWSSTDPNMKALYTPASTSPTKPEIASVNLSVSQVMYFQTGSNGSSGSSGANGTSGTSGINGSSGSSGMGGSSGTSGSNGSSGTSGSNGSSGTSGSNGSSGTSGSSGSSGTSASSGTAGTSGTSGTSGQQGPTGPAFPAIGFSSTTPGLDISTSVGATGVSNYVKIPAGTFTTGDNIEIMGRYKINNPIVTTDPTQACIYFSTTPTMTGAVLGGITMQTIPNINLTNYYLNVTRTFSIIDSSGNMIDNIAPGINTNFDLSNANNAIYDVNINGVNWNNDVYVLFAITTNNILNSAKNLAYYVVNKKGAKGDSGSSGTSGNTGSSGTSGNTGSSGSSGSRGTSGINGSSGTSGSNGSSGTSGSNGSSGTSGNTGSSGTAGTSGLSGSIYVGTSTTTMTISNGIKSFTTQTGLAYSPNQDVTINENGNPTANHMHGIIQSYDSGTGAIVVDVSQNSGSGTYSSWTINLDGAVGATGSNGTSGINGSSGTSGSNGSSGTSGSNGTSGSAGTSGNSGSSGTSGIDGSSGTSGNSGSSGTSGVNGNNGSAGTSGNSGSSGTSGVNGNNGSAGTSGDSGSSGTSGVNGSSGTSGVDGATGATGPAGSGGRGPIIKSGYANPTWLSIGGLEYEATVTFASYGYTDFPNANYTITTSFQWITDQTETIGIYSQTASSFVVRTSTTNAPPITLDFNWTAIQTGDLAANGSSGSSGTSGVNGSAGTSGVNGSAGTSGNTGVSGSSGTSGAAGISGSSGTSGSQGPTGPTGGISGDYVASDATYVWTTNVAKPASTTRISIQPGDLRAKILINQDDQLITGQQYDYTYGSQISGIGGGYNVLIGRNITSASVGNIILGYGSNINSTNRDSIAMGNSATIPNIGGQYGDTTIALGFGISAKMRGALNVKNIWTQATPGGTAGAAGYYTDAAFYSGYVGVGGTTPSGATAGSFYATPGGGLRVAGNGGYESINYSVLNYADDTAAAAGGVVLGQLYHTNGTVKVRIT